MTDITAVETPASEPSLNLPKWREEGGAISKEHARHQWLIADWLLAGIESFPAAEVYDTAVRLFPQYSRATLQTWASVAKAFPPFIRNKTLTFGHHQAAMTGEIDGNKLTPEANAIIRRSNLAAAEAAGWTVGQLRDHINHELEIRVAAKEAERLAEEPPVEPPTPRKPKGRPLSAWTLASLTPAYRSKIEKLAIARCMPIPVLAQSILEQALNDADEEIRAVEDSAYRAEAARRANEERQKAEIARRATSHRFEIDKLIREHGGTAEDYELAVQEWKDRLRAGGGGYPGDDSGREHLPPFTTGFVNCYDYAAWRVHRMEDQAWEENTAENARRDRERDEDEARAENAQRDRELAEIEAKSTEEIDISEEEAIAL
jgi:hypothetical protein